MPYRQVSDNQIDVNYDGNTHILTIDLAPGKVAESDEDKPGVILDYDTDGNLLGLEQYPFKWTHLIGFTCSKNQ